MLNLLVDILAPCKLNAFDLKNYYLQIRQILLNLHLIGDLEVFGDQLVDLAFHVEDVEGVADSGRERRPFHRSDSFPVSTLEIVLT